MRDCGGEVTQILGAIARGDQQSLDGLLPLVYDELREMARAQMTQERGGHTLQPTALVHEAYMRLLGDRVADWPSRRYFFAAAGQAMRRILVEHARSRGRRKRGGNGRLRSLDSAADVVVEDAVDWLELDEAIEALLREDERLADVVHLRFFAGLGVEETALALQVSPSTVKRDWRYAKAFLFQHLHENDVIELGERNDES